MTAQNGVHVVTEEEMEKQLSKMLDAFRGKWPEQVAWLTSTYSRQQLYPWLSSIALCSGTMKGHPIALAFAANLMKLDQFVTSEAVYTSPELKYVGHRLLYAMRGVRKLMEHGPHLGLSMQEAVSDNVNLMLDGPSGNEYSEEKLSLGDIGTTDQELVAGMLNILASTGTTPVSEMLKRWGNEKLVPWAFISTFVAENSSRINLSNEMMKNLLYAGFRVNGGVFIQEGAGPEVGLSVTLAMQQLEKLMESGPWNTKDLMDQRSSVLTDIIMLLGYRTEKELKEDRKKGRIELQKYIPGKTIVEQLVMFIDAEDEVVKKLMLGPDELRYFMRAQPIELPDGRKVSCQPERGLRKLADRELYELWIAGPNGWLTEDPMRMLVAEQVERLVFPVPGLPSLSSTR